MNLAPIIIFAFNRPKHLEETLNALAENMEAKNSDLYIFCDAPKTNVEQIELIKINKVLDVAKSESRFKNVSVSIRERNYGLSKSVISGVTEVIEKRKTVIVLEDDIIVGKYFLQFINKGLLMYENEPNVYGVTGHCFSSSKKVKQDTYFLPIMSSWGYATWLDRWRKINFNGFELLKEVNSRKLQFDINFGELDYYNMLRDQVNGKNDSWAVRFYVSMYLNKGIFLYPNKPLLKNIGLDGSGIHCLQGENKTKTTNFNKLNKVVVNKAKVKSNHKIVKAIKLGNRAYHKTLIQTLKNTIRKNTPPEFTAYLKRKINYKSNKELNRLSKLNRFTKVKTDLLGKTLVLPDAASFIFMYTEIFKEEIYKFQTTNLNPFIIDAGANIGLASIYFKIEFPEAEIIAFEPDYRIFNMLSDNIESFGFKNVNLVNKGVWIEDAILPFHSEGADAGTINLNTSNKNKVQEIKVVALDAFINKHVDFLKIDIEGAETQVLKSIESKLHFVERIFVEYHSYLEQEQTLDEIISILKANGFRLYISAGLFSKSPFVNIKSYANMDMQLNIYGIKIVKN